MRCSRNGQKLRKAEGKREREKPSFVIVSTEDGAHFMQQPQVIVVVVAQRHTEFACDVAAHSYVSPKVDLRALRARSRSCSMSDVTLRERPTDQSISLPWKRRRDSVSEQSSSTPKV